MHPKGSIPVLDERLPFLDGLRGVAIMLVVLYHVYARWPNLMPYHYQFVDVPIFKYGHLGVQLFFMISGFVILMSLEKSASFTRFMFQRWLRLFPAMAVCSLLVFITAKYFPERPAGQPIPRDLLPGLTFIEPDYWRRWLGGNQGMLEGSFWSLFVEIKFYLIFGLMYEVFGSRGAMIGLTLLFVVSCVIDSRWGQSFRGLQLGHNLQWMGARFYGWFAAGAWSYKYFTDGSKLDALAALTLGVATVWFTVAGKPLQLAALVLVIAFLAAVSIRYAQTFFGSRALVFLGLVSYPLYLLHENLMVSMTVKLARIAPDLTPALVPILPIVLVITLAWLVARYAEPQLRRLLRVSIENVLRGISQTALIQAKPFKSGNRRQGSGMSVDVNEMGK